MRSNNFRCIVNENNDRKVVNGEFFVADNFHPFDLTVRVVRQDCTFVVVAGVENWGVVIVAG